MTGRRGVKLDPVRLRYEMDIRLWGLMALSRASRVAPTTINKALAGGQVRPDVADKLINAFLQNAPVEGVAEMLPDLAQALEAQE